MKNIRKITLCGIFSALCTITFIIENQFPPLFVPGAKMGLSNIFILLSGIYLGAMFGLMSLFIKLFVGSLFLGFGSLLYSLPSGFISIGIEFLLIYYTKASIPAISIFGATVSEIIQNLIFCSITKTLEYLVYLPYLTLISIISGLIVGCTVYLIIKKLPLSLFKEAKIET